jgi:predicted N-formylglutamate amidohydrolase
MSQGNTQDLDDPVERVNASGASSVVLVCEHASPFIPAEFDDLGLPADKRQSHVVWDPGAMGVARALSGLLDAALIAGAVSRLVYDCNRPPDAPDAMPAQSETVQIPGNRGLSEAAHAARTQTYYTPFRIALAGQITATTNPVIVTIHSFTPVYHGQTRAVEIGVLHDVDSRLVDTMIASAARHTDLNVQRNQPYGPADGVTHTLKEHALPGGHLNVMLELRNDLIQTPQAQSDMAKMLAVWLTDAFESTGVEGSVQCRA